MSIALINNLSRYRQSALGTALQDTGLTTNTTGNNLNGIDSFSVGLQPDNGQLSPFAQLLNTLQQLQQSDPTKYQQVAQQIATNLQTAAQTAQTDGNTTAASRLNQLAADFTNASQNGQLPNIQDLAQAIGGHHHHYHIHSPSADSGSDPTTSSSSSSASSTNIQDLAQAIGGHHHHYHIHSPSADSGSDPTTSSSSSSASSTNIQDLAQAIGGHHHHYHIHSPSADSGSDPTTSSSSSSASSTSSAGSTSQSLDQFLAAFEASGTQNGSFNPMAIILDTLSNSGTSISNA